MICDICCTLSTVYNQCAQCKYVQCVNCSMQRCLVCLTHFETPLPEPSPISFTPAPRLLQQPVDILDNLLTASEKIPLPNQINSCYINAALQILLHCDVLWCSLLVTFPNTKNLLQHLRTEYCKFAGISTFDQCDAVLFLNWVLDKCSKTNYWWKQEWTSSFKCLSCGHSSKGGKQTENMWILYPKHTEGQPEEVDGCMYDVEMGDCVDMQTTEEVEKTCDECKSKKSQRSQNLFNLPPNLFFNLQHFAGKRMYFYDELELEICAGQRREYVLKGFIMHRGGQNSGHYVCCCLDSDGWTVYDDDRIRHKPSFEFLMNLQSPNVTIPLLWYQRKVVAVQEQQDES